MRKTKIICTLGPATDNDDVLRALMKNGMDVARFNFSHGDYETHKKRFAPLIEKFKDAYKIEANVWMILNHILNVMLDFAVKVHNNQMPNNDDYLEHVFRVIYASVKQYFKNSKESDS